eukprot:11425.XXX_236412_236627_1 [CDS] Oithona nana genome sequencing.
MGGTFNPIFAHGTYGGPTHVGHWATLGVHSSWANHVLRSTFHGENVWAVGWSISRKVLIHLGNFERGNSGE